MFGVAFTLFVLVYLLVGALVGAVIVPFYKNENPFVLFSKMVFIWPLIVFGYACQV